MKSVVHHSKIRCRLAAMGHSRPSHFVPVLNNVRYASDSDHSRYESELTLWAKSRHSALQYRTPIGGKADIANWSRHVRLWPKADVRTYGLLLRENDHLTPFRLS